MPVQLWMIQCFIICKNKVFSLIKLYCDFKPIWKSNYRTLVKHQFKAATVSIKKPLVK